MTAILAFSSHHILYAAWFSYFDYDLGKAVSYLSDASGFVDYARILGFGQGIAFQFYMINLLVPYPPTTLLKTLSYAFLLASFVFVAWQATSQMSGAVRLRNILLIAAISPAFFHGQVISYLGSYGMLVYCQQFFFGALLLYFCRTWLWHDTNIPIKTAAVWACIFAVATFTDIRFSFYACIAFGVAVAFSLPSPRHALRTALAGAAFGIAISIPIVTQYLIKGDLFEGYKPAHIRSMLFDGPLSVSGALEFVAAQSKALLASFVVVEPWWIPLTISALLLVGAVRLLIQASGRPILAFLVACLALQLGAALAGIYPFGSIRYAVPLFPFLLFTVWTGFLWIFKPIDRVLRTEWQRLIPVLLFTAGARYGTRVDANP